MSNFWGPPDEDVEFPDWMLPDSHPMKRKNALHKFKTARSLEEAAAEALKKPPVPILLKDPTINDN